MLLADPADGPCDVLKTSAGVLDQHVLAKLQRVLQAHKGVVLVSLFAPLLSSSPFAVIGAIIPAPGE